MELLHWLNAQLLRMQWLSDRWRIALIPPAGSAAACISSSTTRPTSAAGGADLAGAAFRRSPADPARANTGRCWAADAVLFVFVPLFIGFPARALG
ncbi:MAG: hypothetical protein IPH90_06635 [Thermomonas sp.]|nr:hypothetical protein [Thermomonas sp.]